MKTLSLSALPEYQAAIATETLLAKELADLDFEIAKFEATAKELTPPDPLASALAFINGGPENTIEEERAHLSKKFSVLSAGYKVAHQNHVKVSNECSRLFMEAREPDVLAAVNGLADALQSALLACDAFKAIRTDVAAHGFNHNAAPWPIEIDDLLREPLAMHLATVHESRDALHEKLTCPVSEPDIRIILHTPIYGIKGLVGDIVTVPGKVGRGYVRAGYASVETRAARLLKATA